MKALLLDSDDSKNGPKVYALDIIIHLRKFEFVFSTSQQPPRVAACYEGSGRYNSTLKI